MSDDRISGSLGERLSKIISGSPETGWRVIHAGKEGGPFSESELIEKAVAGDILADDLVKHTDGLWTKASDAGSLQKCFLPKTPEEKPSDTTPEKRWPARCAQAASCFGLAGIAYPFCITGPLFSIAALILGCMGLKSENRRWAIVGIVLGSLSLFAFAFMISLDFQTRKLVAELQQNQKSNKELPFNQSPKDSVWERYPNQILMIAVFGGAVGLVVAVAFLGWLTRKSPDVLLRGNYHWVCISCQSIANSISGEEAVGYFRKTPCETCGAKMRIRASAKPDNPPSAF